MYDINTHIWTNILGKHPAWLPPLAQMMVLHMGWYNTWSATPFVGTSVYRCILPEDAVAPSLPMFYSFLQDQVFLLQPTMLFRHLIYDPLKVSAIIHYYNTHTAEEFMCRGTFHLETTKIILDGSGKFLWYLLHVITSSWCDFIWVNFLITLCNHRTRVESPMDAPWVTPGWVVLSWYHTLSWQ